MQLLVDISGFLRSFTHGSVDRCQETWRPYTTYNIVWLYIILSLEIIRNILCIPWQSPTFMDPKEFPTSCRRPSGGPAFGGAMPGRWFAVRTWCPEVNGGSMGIQQGYQWVSKTLGYQWVSKTLGYQWVSKTLGYQWVSKTLEWVGSTYWCWTADLYTSR